MGIRDGGLVSSPVPSLSRTVPASPGSCRPYGHALLSLVVGRVYRSGVRLVLLWACRPCLQRRQLELVIDLIQPTEQEPRHLPRARHLQEVVYNSTSIGPNNSRVGRLLSRTCHVNGRELRLCT